MAETSREALKRSAGPRRTRRERHQRIIALTGEILYVMIGDCGVLIGSAKRAELHSRRRVGVERWWQDRRSRSRATSTSGPSHGIRRSKRRLSWFDSDLLSVPGGTGDRVPAMRDFAEVRDRTMTEGFARAVSLATCSLFENWPTRCAARAIQGGQPLCSATSAFNRSSTWTRARGGRSGCQTT